MYSLRGQRCGLVLLADADDPTTWSEQAEFSMTEGCYLILTGPAGDSISNAVTTKQFVGLDCYSTKIMFGDWLWWSDQSNGLIRLVSPQGFTAGRLANLSPEQSSLNKQLYGIIGSQTSGQPQSREMLSYSSADLATLFSAGIDVISNPQPAGSFWGVRGGRNSASDVTKNGDNYARLTNFISETLSAGMGQYVGQVITGSLYQSIRGTLLSFLHNMFSQGLLGSADGSLPYSVICDNSNNPATMTGLGYVQANVQVQYQAINEKFIISLEGGQTVQVAMQTLPAGQPGQ
jgi:phage tail sheath protein FI